MLPVSGEIAGIKLEILEYTINKKYICDKGCYRLTNCELRKNLVLHEKANVLTATEVVFSILNTSSSFWNIGYSEFEVIDNTGYSYKAHNLCDELRPSRYLDADGYSGHSISPSARANFILIFPELEKSMFSRVDICFVVYRCNNASLRMEINPFPPEIQKIFLANEVEPENVVNDYQIQALVRKIDWFEKLIFERLHTTLSVKAQTTLDNKIKITEFSIMQEFRNFSKERIKQFEIRFDNLKIELKNAIALIDESKKESTRIDQKVAQLYELSPREFEEWTASLFSALGYEKVTLTQQSNDKGVDVLAEKNGLRIAVQCKKYKGVVGSPEIQTFLGAMQYAEADKGFYITTGTFSIEAEKMALDMPIELYDKASLRDLIIEALRPNE